MSNSLLSYGWDDRVAALFTLVDVPGHEPARVIRTDRGSSLVITEGGTKRATPYTLVSRRHGIDGAVATGDWVAIIEDPDEGHAVVAVLPRRSELSRRDPEPGAPSVQVLAANVDLVAVVCPLDRPVAPARVERFATLAWESGAIPIVVLTKSDVVADAQSMRALVQDAAPGVDVFITSGASGEGIDAIAELIAPARTLALLGPSGAGKSTLVNRLAGEDVQLVSDVRAGDNRGRHTTTSRELVPVPTGGVLLDTPGVRSLGLWDVDEGLVEAFPEIDELAQGCRFRDCAHDTEPECAVNAAVAEGTLDVRRLDSYRKLEREIARLNVDLAARKAVRVQGRAYRAAAKLNPKIPSR